MSDADLEADLFNLAMSEKARPLLDGVMKHIIDNVEPIGCKNEGGLFQGIGTTCASSACGDCIGDINGDGVRDFVDLVLLLASWGPCEPINCPADIDGDGFVALPDLLLLLSNWGECP